MMTDQEWDWPPARHRVNPAVQIEGRIERERVIIPTRQRPPPPKANFANRAADAFFRAVVVSLKIVAGAFLGFIIFGALWLMGALVSHGS